MAAEDFQIMQGTSQRFQIASDDAATPAAPYDFTSTVVTILTEFPTPLEKSMVVDALGVGTSSTGVQLGRFNPADPDGPLIDTDASDGYVIVRYGPEDTATIPADTYRWEARVVGAADTHTLGVGTITVIDSIFEEA